MGQQTQQKPTKRTVKKSNADTKLLEKTITEQFELLLSTSAVFDAMHDTLVDAEHLLAEESIDDIFGIGLLKEDVGKIMDKLKTWKNKQQVVQEE